MSTNEILQHVDERGWRRGLDNLLKGESSAWFRSRKWWVHSLMWLLCINLILFFTTLDPEAGAPATGGIPDTLELYGIFGGMFVMMGVLVILQGAIVGEKKSGTAAWILSKPVSRTAFVVAKTVGNSLGVLATAVLVPGVVAYLEIGLMTDLGWLSPLSFLVGVVALALHAIFWITFTIMLGSFFDAWAPVIGIPLALAFGQQLIVGLIPPLLYVFPWALAAPVGDDKPALAASLFNGAAPFSWIPLLSALVFSGLFTSIAIWRFNRQEF
jgi:ABC-2 type transport system permease protein